MPKDKTIQAYLTAVTEQIRWKRVRPMIARELEQHLEEQRDAFIKNGIENAEQLAVEEMGDPVAVGLELDALHRPKTQWGLLLLTIGFALAGTVFRIYLREDWIDPVVTVAAFLLGCGILFAEYFLDYGFLARHSGAVYLAALAAGVFSLVYSKNINGASYYTRYVVLCYPVVYAFWLYHCRNKGWFGVVLAFGGWVPLAAICLLTPYLSLSFCISDFMDGWDYFACHCWVAELVCVGEREDLVLCQRCYGAARRRHIVYCSPSLY